MFVDKYLTPISVLLAAIIIGGALVISGGPRASAPAEPQGLTQDTMDELAEDLDMDTDRIRNLLKKNGSTYQAAIDADQAEGKSFGIQGTPGSIVGKQLIPGAYPLDVVLAAIDGKPVPLPEGLPPAEGVDIAKVKLDTSPSLGSPDAPVMAVWYDYQCIFCKKFDKETLSALEDSHVKTGKLRIVFKDFQFLGPASTEAGLYSRAVWEAYPDRWHDWFKAMMAL